MSDRSLFSAIARWLFLGILVYAPWAYGSTRLWTMEILDFSLFACFGFHVAGLVWERRLPAYPFFPAVCLAALLAETLWMYANARFYHDVVFWEFVPLQPFFPALPGSWDRAATLFYLQRQLAMAAAFLVAAEMVSDPKWKPRILTTLALTGTSIVIYGLAQRVLNAPSIFWLKEDTGSTFFATYRYHANAGAFLNLVWPVILLLFLQSFLPPKAHVARALWSSALFLTLVACAVNVSRAAAAITALLAALGGAWFFLILRRRGAPLSFWKMTGIVLGVVIFAGAVLLGGVADRSEIRWAVLGQQKEDWAQRYMADQACFRALPDAGWLGYGAGTFSAIFPDHTAYLGGRLIGFWRFAHQDYLQTVLEYGYLGATVWALFVFGGMGRAVRWAFSSRVRTRECLLYAASVLAVGGIMLHSLVDFPLQIASIQLEVMVFLALMWTGPSKAAS